MYILYMFDSPLIWGLPLLIQIISYFKILKKMDKDPRFCIIPVLGEMQMSKDLFKRMASFWRPTIVTIAMIITTQIIGDDNEYGIILKLVALIVYGIFLIRLYWRLGKQFGKGVIFRLGMILLPFIFLPILGFGKKSVYLGKRQFKPEKEQSVAVRRLKKAGFVAISAVELAALVVVCFFITLIVHPLRPVAQFMMNDTIKQLASVTDSDEIVGRDVTIGADYQTAVDEQRTRDYFFPDHSSDKKVVVMEYIIGSDLEDGRGFASINISQMKDSTAMGDGLDFVIQAGGSKRWFTKGISDNSVGRYVLSGGKLETAELLDESTCMADPENLTDFIKWTAANYPADRYMLVLWDHGGGFASGYGYDDLNKRSGDHSFMTASEIIGAIRDAGTKFDVIGFDACLMQNVEYANALEPYADYYLASEETEPGSGWFYTAGFGKLAADPTLSTEELGKSLISSYDQSQRALNKGEPKHDCTLSLVDLTLIKPVYEQLTDFYKDADESITDNRAVFANMSAARSYAYQFADYEQVDLISYLTSLKNADYKQQVTTDAELEKIAKTAKTCVVYHNSDSAQGINGIAIDFPYESLSTYSDEHDQLKAVKYSTEQKFFDKFCSIIASQRMNQTDKENFWGILNFTDYSKEDWYIKGFEDYDTTKVFIDIPVKEVENGYLPELPEKTWDTILDCKIAAFLETEDGLLYLGQEHFSEQDAEGHPIVSMDGVWARVNGHMVCYETEDPLVTEEGMIYRGTVRAKLNGSEDIRLHIEWNPVKEDSEGELTGQVKGYSRENQNVSFFMKRGLEQFETGDTIEFVFDFYDEEGNITKTTTYGDMLRVITDDRLTVKDELFESGSIIQYFGVLKDVYQRELMTEEIREQVE